MHTLRTDLATTPGNVIYFLIYTDGDLHMNMVIDAPPMPDGTPMPEAYDCISPPDELNMHEQIDWLLARQEVVPAMQFV